MNEDYQYPLMDGLSDDEVVDLMTFYQRVEDAYERPAGVNRAAFIEAYRAFTRVIPSQMEQKQLERAFEDRSGYDPYAVIKLARGKTDKMLKIDEA
ncbi:hypothetical protein HMPREF9103_00341 [Lentilactobacillus parafarraginis F0439]|uniref:Uncharacterized protein n=1 Tax=Lentilactobacillus parafarraginis F0439 TaxID=797515 RepID=G9ZKU3_9LACO|nr:UPF0223 family protein [Lentilactobacillus parafarraginis]EHM00702.1 hypothetical protein HMPREF9103_00341 [Lentilactobacillus parafarraginis F0439]